jgi:hypothetical protein
VSEDAKGTGLLDATGLIIGGVNDLAVVDNHGETTSSLAQVPADAGGELGIVVGHEENLVIGDTVGLGPTVHDKCVVDSNDDDLVNALGLNLVNVLDVGRNVRATASRSESTRDGDNDDLLVLELVTGVVVSRSAAGREFSDLRSGLDVAEEDTFGEVGADLEFRHFDCVGEGGDVGIGFLFWKGPEFDLYQDARGDMWKYIEY